MNKKTFLVLFLCTVLCACGPGGESPKRTPSAIAVDTTAPDFTLKDLNGRDVSLGSMRDRPVLLVFGTTWCPYCREEIPRMKEIYSQGAGKKLEVLNIYINEEQKKVADFAARHALPYPVLLDRDGKVAERYQVRGVPMLVLLDRQGKIACIQCRNVEALLQKM